MLTSRSSINNTVNTQSTSTWGETLGVGRKITLKRYSVSCQRTTKILLLIQELQIRGYISLERPIQGLTVTLYLSRNFAKHKSTERSTTVFRIRFHNHIYVSYPAGADIALIVDGGIFAGLDIIGLNEVTESLVEQFINDLPLGTQGYQIGLATQSRGTYQQINLNYTFDTESFYGDVLGLLFDLAIPELELTIVSDIGEIVDVLEKTRVKLLTNSSAGSRPGFPKIAFLLTDGFDMFDEDAVNEGEYGDSNV